MCKIRPVGVSNPTFLVANTSLLQEITNDVLENKTKLKDQYTGSDIWIKMPVAWFENLQNDYLRLISPQISGD